MAFIIGEVTAFGRNLMAQATATNKIVYTHAIAESVPRSRDEIKNAQSIPAASGVRISGVILSSSSTGNVARISTQFTNQAATRYALTIWLYGRLESQGSANVVAAIVSDSNIYFPANTLAETKIAIDFNIAMLNGTSTVQITEASAATVGQLKALEEKSFGLGDIQKRRILKQYANFLEAQCYAEDGEDFTLRTHQSAFTIRFEVPSVLDDYAYSSIADICDHWLLMLLMPELSQASSTAAPSVLVFDLKQATFSANGIEIRLGSPSFYGKTPPAFVEASLLKVENDYFATFLASNDGQWQNTSFGQTQTQGFTGKNAVMPLQNSHDGQVDYTAGFFYPASDEIEVLGRGKYATFTEADQSFYIGMLSLRKIGQSSQGLFPMPDSSEKHVSLAKDLFLNTMVTQGSSNGGLNYFVINDTQDGGFAYFLAFLEGRNYIMGGVVRFIEGENAAHQDIIPQEMRFAHDGFSDETRMLYPELNNTNKSPWWDHTSGIFELGTLEFPFITPSKDGVNFALMKEQGNLIEFGLHSYDSCLVERKPYSIPALDEHTFTLANAALPRRVGAAEEPAIPWLSFGQYPGRNYVVGNTLLFSPSREETKNHFVYQVKQDLYRKTNGKI